MQFAFNKMKTLVLKKKPENQWNNLSKILILIFKF